MQVIPRKHLSTPPPILASNLKQDITSSITPPIVPIDLEHSDSTFPLHCSKPKLIHPDEMTHSEDPVFSMQELVLDGLAEFEEYTRNKLNYLHNKQSILMKSMLDQKQKISELHQASQSLGSKWKSIVDIALPLCSGIIALYLGFSPDYSLSKVAAICASTVGFSIAALQLTKIPLSDFITTGYMTLFNLYMAFIHPTNILTLVMNFLQVFPTISEFVSKLEQNSMGSEEALAQRVIKSIDQELKNVAIEISRMIKMMSENKKFFSITCLLYTSPSPRD